MIVICKECETAFNIDESLVNESGSRARCSKCSHEFLVYPSAVGSEPEPESAVSEPDPVSDEPPDTLEDDLSLLDTDPIPFDCDEEDTTAITIEDADPGLEDAGEFEFSASGDDVEETDGSDLPDLEGFDEDFLSEDDLISDDESTVSNPEGILEEDEETPVTANPDSKMSETDEIDLTDLEELINMEDFPDAGELEEISPGAPGNLLEIEDENLYGSADYAGPAAGSDVLDFSDLEEMVARDDEPEPLPESGSEADDRYEEIESAGSDDEGREEEIFDIDTLVEGAEITTGGDDTTEKAAGLTATGSEPELEISFDPEGQLFENDTIDVAGAPEDGNPDLFFPESETADSHNDSEDQISTPGEKSFSGTRESGSTTGDFTIEDITETTDLNGKTREIDQIPVKPSTRVTRSRTRIAALALFALLIAAAGILVTARTAGFKIPYLGDVAKNIPMADSFFSSENSDSVGNLAITPLEKTVTAEFVENDGAGRLFVVRGQVLNEYDHPRSFIKITAKLYQKDNKLIKTAEVYCGNVIAEQDLTGMEFSAISRRLQNRFGDRRSNLKVKSGKALPFMIVFNQLPESLDEYSVEVAESAG